MIGLFLNLKIISRERTTNMSKKKPINKKLLKGKFYLVHDGSKSGHPGFIFWKNDNKNLYLSLIVGTSYSKDLIKLNFSTEIGVSKSFVHKKPFLGKRKDFGSKELKRLKFNKNDKKRILRDISKKEPRYSPTIKRHDRRYMKRLRLKKIPKY